MGLIRHFRQLENSGRGGSFYHLWNLLYFYNFLQFLFTNIYNLYLYILLHKNTFTFISIYG